jgi:hypothetical protein
VRNIPRLKNNAGVGDFVEAGSGDLFTTIESHVTPALIVRNNHDDVRAIIGKRKTGTKCGQQKNEQIDSHVTDFSSGSISVLTLIENGRSSKFAAATLHNGWNILVCEIDDRF